MFGTKKNGKKCENCGECHDLHGEQLATRAMVEAMREMARMTLGYELPLVVVKTEKATALDVQIKNPKVLKQVLISLFQHDEVADMARELLDADEE